MIALFDVNHKYNLSSFFEKIEALYTILTEISPITINEFKKRLASVKKAKF